MPDHSPDEHHRQISDGWIRAGIFGVSDGLVTNTSFILGFAGASPGHNVVRLAGVATLIAGGFSMASGEWLSMRATKELLEFEIGVERQSIARRPGARTVGTSRDVQSRGIDDDLAERLSIDLMRDPELALQTHVREEMGVDPSATGSPWAAACVPRPPSPSAPLSRSCPGCGPQRATRSGGRSDLAAVGSAGVGGAIGLFTRRGITKWALRQVVVTGLAAVVTFGVGRLVGSH